MTLLMTITLSVRATFISPRHVLELSGSRLFPIAVLFAMVTLTLNVTWIPFAAIGINEIALHEPLYG